MSTHTMTEDLHDERQKNLIARWALTALIDLQGWKLLKRNHSGYTSDRSILEAIDLVAIEDLEMSGKSFLARLKKQQRLAAALPAEANTHLCHNCRLVADHLSLTEAEHDLLLFCVILKGSRCLGEVFELFGEVNATKLAIIIAAVLDLEIVNVRKAMSKDGLLARSGLLTVDRQKEYDISNKIDLIEGIIDTLNDTGTSLETIFHHYFSTTPPAQLTKDDFAHVHASFDVIEKHLQAARERCTSGINVLLYGPPGTGKTEMAKTIAATLGYRLYEVALASEDAIYNKPKRIRAYQLAQEVLHQTDASLMLFDEVDGLLTGNSGFMWFDDSALQMKACINKCLEQNPVPTIWIANDIAHAEKAFLRRFDIVLHLDYPPRSVRKKILQNALRGIEVNESWLDGLAGIRTLAPAVVTRAASVVSNQGSPSPQAVQHQLQTLISSTHVAMGGTSIPLATAADAPDYRLDLVNCDCDLEQLLGGLCHRAVGRLCLFGPPGTGKTEFGRYLAKSLDRHLLLKRGSDLLSPYLGETEANIAAMFREASTEQAVLLLDEADGFLRDRRGATRSWEVTQVNELLTHMECFQGVFVCSTNLFEMLDEASLRRFDLKIKFDFLEEEQAWQLFCHTLETCGVAITNDDRWRYEITQLTRLTPGDFATVMRKSRLQGDGLNPHQLLHGLRQEVLFKPAAVTGRIGFLRRAA